MAISPGGSLDFWHARAGDPDRIPAAPLVVALRNPRVLTFLGVWFALNLLFGLGSFSIADYDQNLAWEAHIGGFLAGLLLFSLFDPVLSERSDDASHMAVPTGPSAVPGIRPMDCHGGFAASQ